MSSNHYLVLLRCGHWYRESRPRNIAQPTQGEYRVCAVIAHYPEKFEAFYLHMQPKIVTQWFDDGDRGRQVPPGDWEEAFNAWLNSIDDVVQNEEIGLCKQAWKAALASILPLPATGAGPFA